MLFLDYFKFLVVKVVEGWYYWFSKGLIFALYHQNTLLLLSKPTHKNKSSFCIFIYQDKVKVNKNQTCQPENMESLEELA